MKYSTYLYIKNTEECILGIRKILKNIYMITSKVNVYFFNKFILS